MVVTAVLSMSRYIHQWFHINYVTSESSIWGSDLKVIPAGSETSGDQGILEPESWPLEWGWHRGWKCAPGRPDGATLSIFLVIR